MFTYCSPLYLISVASSPAVAALFWYLFKKKNKKTQQILILAIMLANIIQHLFKSVIYPQYAGQGFTAISSAYNMCALLILASPIALFSKSRKMKNFIYYVGTIAGFAAIIIPAWYIGDPVQSLGWDYFRYYVCHLGLFLSSILPLLFRHHKAQRKEFWQVGLCFLLALCVILLNDVIFAAMGLYPQVDINHFYDSMAAINPFGMMGPPAMAQWVLNIVRPFTPSVFLGNNPAGAFVPILWYAIPLYLGVSLISFVIFSITDRKKR